MRCLLLSVYLYFKSFYLSDDVFFYCSHGLTFYKDLKETLTKFEKKVGDFYQRREKEKAKFLEKKKKDSKLNKFINCYEFVGK